MCDILQSQQVGSHTSVHLRSLVECVLAQPSPPREPEYRPCEKPHVDHRQVAPTTTQYLYKKLFTYPEPVCGYTIYNPNERACGHGGNVQKRQYPPQGKIEYICQSNQRPVASTIIAQKRAAAAAVQIHKHYEHPPVAPPCPPMPQMKQPGVPVARCRGY